MIEPVVGTPLSPVERVDVIYAPGARANSRGLWALRGVEQPDHYTTGGESARLEAVQPPLGRLEATQAALIPVKKSNRWWQLGKPRRREIFEERSHHIATGLQYLPAVARRLFHCRELGEPFDFLTWFEYAPKDAGAFEELVRRLRESPEWSFVEREVDIRLSGEG